METCTVSHNLVDTVGTNDVDGTVEFVPDLADGAAWSVLDGGVASTVPAVPIALDFEGGQYQTQLFAAGPLSTPSRAIYWVNFTRLEVEGAPAYIEPFRFEAVPGGHVDLSLALPVSGTTPPVTRGEPGPPGADGSPGPPGEPGPPGADGSVMFESLTPEQIAEITGPPGEPGPPGADGSPGPPGEPGPPGADGKNAGYWEEHPLTGNLRWVEGTSVIWSGDVLTVNGVSSPPLTGPPGEPGPPGADGEPGSGGGGGALTTHTFKLTDSDMAHSHKVMNETSAPRLTRVGDLVILTGRINHRKPPTSSDRQIFNIPLGYRPDRTEYGFLPLGETFKTFYITTAGSAELLTEESSALNYLTIQSMTWITADPEPA